MDDELLIVEDLLLLLLDDDGASIAGAGTLHYTLGGAVLVDLALRGRIEEDKESGGILNGPIIRQVGTDPLSDPVLQTAFEKVGEKPRRVQPLLLSIGANLLNPLAERLEQRGMVNRESRRFLGLFRTTAWPAADQAHETELRRKINAVLVDGEQPDPRVAAVIALLSASGAMPALRPPVPWTSQTIARAKELESGDWGAAAVSTAVTRTAAAIAASSAVATGVAITAAATAATN